MNLSKKMLPHYLRSAGRGGAGDMSSMSACSTTALRLAWGLRAISALGTPSASIDRISFLMSRGHGHLLHPSRAGSALVLFLLNSQ